ncbi:acyltransferase family protein [Rhizobium tubonense]|uniref:acyltransferase family protein n=1 Tax=Rhizobium tubonense TaxID=484088 RepID=UPI0018A81AFE|nr:acyltransferase [Rhizobium tubonense]
MSIAAAAIKPNIRSQSAHNLSSLQAARCFACLLVVFHHTIRLFTANAPADWTRPLLFDFPALYERLAVGVDIFFVISGFIMTYVAAPYIDGRKPLSDFLLKRALRIYPSYLLVTVALVIPLVAVYVITGHLSFDLSWERLFTSATLIPDFNKLGQVQPILGVGWTLSFEVYFYIVFAASIALFRGRFLVPMALVIVSIIALSRLLDLPGAVSQFLQNSIAIEFIFGCIIARYFVSGSIIFHKSLLILICLLGFSLFIFESASDDNRFIVWGAPSALFVGGMISFEFNKVIRWSAPIVFLGDASYSIYLVHVPFIYFGCTKLIELLGIHKYSPSFISVAIVFVFSGAVIFGLLFYYFVERTINLKIKSQMNR